MPMKTSGLQRHQRLRSGVHPKKEMNRSLVISSLNSGLGVTKIEQSRKVKAPTAEVVEGQQRIKEVLIETNNTTTMLNSSRRQNSQRQAPNQQPGFNISQLVNASPPPQNPHKAFQQPSSQHVKSIALAPNKLQQMQYSKFGNYTKPNLQKTVENKDIAN